MRNRRSDVVDKAIDVLDDYGLADLSMRRLAGELGIRPSALYHHVASKQELLAAVADEMLRRTLRDVPPDLDWADAVLTEARGLRDAMLAYRDGAELIATVNSFGLAEVSPRERLFAAVARSGAEPDRCHAAAATLVHFVSGHVTDEQTHLQAGSVGALRDAAPALATAASFDQGLELIVAGITATLEATHRPS